jgi:hypothetical protein
MMKRIILSFRRYHKIDRKKVKEDKRKFQIYSFCKAFSNPKIPILILFAALLILRFSVSAYAADVWYVSTTGLDNNEGKGWSDAFATIQMGVDTAVDGDMVLVADGTYTGEGNFDINFGYDTKNIVIKSLNGPEYCIVDCQGLGRGFRIDWTQTNETVIDGFTIVNGNTNNTYSYGGAIQCNGAYPIIRNCIFKNNTGGQSGGALDIRNSAASDQPKVINCLFVNNSASLFGGAVQTYKSAPIFINCTFYGNSVRDFGGAVSLGTPDYGTSFANCIFWNNSPDTFRGAPSVTYSRVPVGYPGVGNINGDPEFIDLLGSDLRLDSISPCIDQGNSNIANLPENDLDGKPRLIDGDSDMNVDVDMGAYEYGDICECDFIGDFDTDGKDLADYIIGSNGVAVSIISSDFGRTDCPDYQESP